MSNLIIPHRAMAFDVAAGPTPLAEFLFENNLTNTGSSGLTGSKTSPTYTNNGAPRNYSLNLTTGESFSVGSVNGVLIGIPELTITIDFKSTAAGNVIYFVGSVDALILRMISGSRLDYYIQNEDSAWDGIEKYTVYNDDAWHTVKITYKVSTAVMTLSVDGTEVGSKVHSGGTGKNIKGHSSLVMVTGDYFGQSLNGMIDNIKAYNVIV
jgi:hypothetical protein